MLFHFAGLLIILVFGFLIGRAAGGIMGGLLDVGAWLDDFLGTASRFSPGPLQRLRARREQRQREAEHREALLAARAENWKAFDKYYGKSYLAGHLGEAWVRRNFGREPDPDGKVPRPYRGPSWFDALTFLRRASIAFTGVFIFGAIMFFIHGFEAEEYDIVSPLGVDWGEIADTPMFTGDVQPSWMLTEEEREADDAESANFRTPYLGSAL